ncbi:hypothetical protein SEA_TIERRA_82 [Mycobacterium phage Tierra]|uniref:Uncharacterized protein n=1 Tax=Mycobacterium phage Unicorn TaxID=2015825 RepID=A0A222ZM47_9CAUD|nr:hypothetical protein I5G78_gp024 [Mycobacterium phage Unicorn]ASR85090.1 hypothetical protein SEA_UNICORN_82 [Mycobacterium phage Unicorn]ASR85190.1 hypothetical protein SEA_PHELPSODU_82 [Mycobacterium phage PhelpsODU]WNM68371.1 hypothetical protein SEA_TIERRA_82 [Mycobacterium phage Tierra]
MQNLTAQNLAGVAWVEDGRRAEFANARREFGVQRADGAWLSFDGVRPYCPRGGRRAAVEVAATIVVDDTVRWVRSI